VLEKIEEFSARHGNVATVLASQMARHDGKPKLNKLYHSGKMEHAAHTVFLIWDAEEVEEEELRNSCRAIDVAKQKDGPTGAFVLGWHPRTVRFFDASRENTSRYWNYIKHATTGE